MTIDKIENTKKKGSKKYMYEVSGESSALHGLLLAQACSF